MIVETIVLFNLLISVIAVWIAMFVAARFLRPAILNEKRFAIYQLRDRLALLAMKGVINENSEEYVTLSRLMNGQINSTKDFRITKFLQLQSKIVTNKRLQAHLESILQKIKNHKMPDEYRCLVVEFFDNSKSIYNHKTWLLRGLLTPLIVIFTTTSHVIKATEKLKEYFISQKARLNNIDSHLRENREKFAM